MEAKYPNLKRPKRKLCYLTNKDSHSKPWAGTLTLGDIDKIFDDLDSSPHDDDLYPPSPLLHVSDSENQGERPASPVTQEEHTVKTPPATEMGPEGDDLPPAKRTPSPKMNIDLDIPFKMHEPVKTSSPIEENVVAQGAEEEESEKKSVSPILFNSDDEEEEAKTEPLTHPKSQCNGHTVESDISELESPPNKVTLSKPMMSSHKKKVEGSCEASDTTKEKTKKSQAPVLEEKGDAPSQKNTDLPVSAVRQEPELTAPEKHSSVHSQPPAEVSTRVGKDMTAFLLKLRDAGQPKPACSRKSLSPVKAPPPHPEPEDDFLILEDDAPLWFSIPSKTATNKRQKLSKTTNMDKDSSGDKRTEDRPQEKAQKEEEDSEKVHTKLGTQPVNQKMKKKKGREKKYEATEPGNDKDELTTPEDLPTDGVAEQEKPNKKKQPQLKKIPSKENHKAKEEPKDASSMEPDEDERAKKMEKKAQKSSEDKSSKSSKDGKENDKTRRAKSLKGTRKVVQRSKHIKETINDETAKEQNKNHSDVEDLATDKENLNSDTQTATDSGDEAKKPPLLSEESSSEEGQVPRKRKRKPTGQWWLSSPLMAGQTKVTDNQPTLKKSKQHNRDPSTAESSPVKAKKERVLKSRNQKQPPPSSGQSGATAKEKKTKRTKNKPARGDTPDKMKATDEVFNTPEAEPVDEQQEEGVPDQDLDPVTSSPLIYTHRDLSLHSGDRVFQRVYHHDPNEKTAGTPARVSSRRPEEQLREAEPGRRRRKRPGNWWQVSDMPKDAESITSQPELLNPKSCKDMKKQSKHSRSPRLGTPKTGNVAVSPKPLGGAHVPSLKPKPPLTPKTIKHSLATFKDIFTSSAETPAVVSSRNTGGNIRRKISVTDCAKLSVTEKDNLNLDAEFNSPPNDDKQCQQENTLKDFRSGPSSMIELEQYEENDDMILPSRRVHDVLSVSDLCAPPLKPLVLQQKDKANLTEWLKSLWSTTVDNGAEITSDQFDWYFYQGRAIGFLVDLNCGSICNGKILLGSLMKKPLWVDHSATSVFNLLTSSVSVVIDGKESRFNPGQSFMVECGQAYSIQNVTAQPAVLYFTRVLAEGSD